MKPNSIIKDDFYWVRECPTVQFLATPEGEIYPIKSEIKGVPWEDKCAYCDQDDSETPQFSRLNKLTNDAIKNTECGTYDSAVQRHPFYIKRKSVLTECRR